MPKQEVLRSFMEPLLDGNREACREVFHDHLLKCAEPRQVCFDLLWPAMEQIDALFRSHRINIASEHMAVRITRVLADQAQTAYRQRESNGKRMLIACADGEPEELGAQMAADLFEADGWNVYFIGGGVPNDEILSLVGQLRPDILLVFGTQPQGVPGVRQLIDLIREVNATPTMNIMVSGGVFNRAEGLWEEVHADLTACSVAEALDVAAAAEPRAPQPVRPGGPKKRRRRRRAPMTETALAQA